MVPFFVTCWCLGGFRKSIAEFTRQEQLPGVFLFRLELNLRGVSRCLASF